jgi:addiction module RelB/DinJ family antitoxin
MSYTVVTTRIDPETKFKAQKTAEDLGIPLSVIVKGFLKQFVKTKRISFSARDEEIPNEYFKQTLVKARRNRKAGKGSPTFSTGEDMAEWLEKQGI